jgi:hypothetical protein
MKPKRWLKSARGLICTAIALGSGGLGAFCGSKLAVSNQLELCQAQPIGLEKLCSTVAAPGAMARGGLTGLWTGAVLGAFVAGVATSERKLAPVKLSWTQFQAWLDAASSQEPDIALKLTDAQAEQILSELGFSDKTIDRIRNL